MIIALLRRLEARHVLELRAVEGGRCSGLERTTEQELRGEERGELHIEPGSRGCHVILSNGGGRHRLSLIHGLSVKLGDVTTARVAMVSEPRHVGGEGTVGEASFTVGRFGRMAEAVAARGRVMSTLSMWAAEVLHIEQMRGDKRVPPGVR
jgi:hypothetical protein